MGIDLDDFNSEGFHPFSVDHCQDLSRSQLHMGCKGHRHFPVPLGWEHTAGEAPEDPEFGVLLYGADGILFAAKSTPLLPGAAPQTPADFRYLSTDNAAVFNKGRAAGRSGN